MDTLIFDVTEWYSYQIELDASQVVWFSLYRTYMLCISIKNATQHLVDKPQKIYTTLKLLRIYLYLTDTSTFTLLYRHILKSKLDVMPGSIIYKPSYKIQGLLMQALTCIVTLHGRHCAGSSLHEKNYDCLTVTYDYMIEHFV